MRDDLPTGWVSARFRDAMWLEERRELIDPAKTYKLLGVRWYGNGAFLREERLGAGLSAQHIYRVKPGDVVYNRLFAWKGSFAVITSDFAGCCVSNEFPLFATKLESIHPSFLLHILRSHRTAERADAFSTGTTSISRNRLNENDFLHFPISLPPLPEQHAIADVLSAIDETIAQTAALVDATKTALNSSLRWFNRNGKPASFPLVELGTVIESTKYGTSAKCDDSASGYPVLRIPNVLSGGIDRRQLKYAHLPPAEAKKFDLRNGDLLAVRTNGNPDYVGRMAVADDLPSNMLFASYLIRIRLDVSKALPEFVWLCSNTYPLRDALTSAARTSAGNFNINTEGLSSAVIPLPSIEEQGRIVATANMLRLRIKAELFYLSVLRQTRFALSQELLSGRFRLPESMIARYQKPTAAAA